MILVWIFVAAAILFGLLGLSLYMLRPETEKTRSFAAFDHTMIAHRGLFDNHSEAPENSLAAFRKAVDQGFGIELDVQLTKDGKLVVFHDFDLKRMCGIHKKLTELTYAELEQYSLKGSTEKIPLFSAVLDLIAGRTPLVVEIKVGYDYKATTEAAAEMLSQYSGVYCMECFNPLALVWYRRHNPKVLRGQLSMDFFHSEDKMPKIVRFFLTNLLLNFCAKPDFISYNHKDRHIRGFRMCRKLFKVKTAAWTIKSQAELEAARGTFDMFIFVSFLPKEGRKGESELRTKKQKIDAGKLLFSNHDLKVLLIPLMVEQLLNSLMGTVDSMMVSNVGSAAISAVSLVDSINVLVIQVFTGTDSRMCHHLFTVSGQKRCEGLQ